MIHNIAKHNVTLKWAQNRYDNLIILKIYKGIGHFMNNSG